MKATPLTPAEIFGNQIRYVVPLFQRPYVWNKIDQWAPLWADVVKVAETVMSTPPPPYGPRVVPPHFLGAVVVEQHHVGVHYISVRGLVDGQQRMTTLQLLMDAAQLVVAAHGDVKDAQALEVLVLNPAQLSANSDERFKVWPTDRDEAAFRAAMDNDTVVPTELQSSRIAQAHQFFYEQITEWAEVTGDPDTAVSRLNALTVTLRDFLKIVVIDLEPGDNAQVIFETLNHRGTPLLAVDLIKNLVFQTAQAHELDINALYHGYWAKLDTDYWRDDIAQGRLYRPRIDIFMNYWLTMKQLREIATDRVFVEFRSFLESDAAPDLPGIVAEIVRDAETYASLANYPADSAIGQFQYRVLRALDSAAVTPFLLWVMSKPDECPPEQRDKALRAVESWLVRRAVCRYTSKGVNQVVVDLLKALEEAGAAKAGEATEAFLAGQTADARFWPTNAQVIRALTTDAVYKNLSRARVRMLLEALEDDIRRSSSKTERQPCPRNLTVEHLMPQGWKTYWPMDPDDRPGEARREHAVQTLGNLTLVTAALNPSMSNAPWTDTEAQIKGIAEGKRSALLHSVLRLNNALSSYTTWDEDHIQQRGESLAARATEIWRRPTLGGDVPVSEPSVEQDTAAPYAGRDGAADQSHDGKYQALYPWLRRQDAPAVHASFSRIEEVLGFPLPESCRSYAAHWSGYQGSAVARAIADAGWKAAQVNLTAESVSFIRNQ